MWFIEPIGECKENNAVYYVVGYCASLGRPPKFDSMPSADILLHGDSTISKIHAQLLVSECSGLETKSSLSLRDISMFGTKINDEKIEKDRPTPLEQGDTIQIGRRVKLRVCWQSVVCCHGADTQLTDEQVELSTAAGIKVTNKWDADCTHVLVNPKSHRGSLHLWARLMQKDVVSNEWIDLLLRERVHKTHLPLISHFQVLPAGTLDPPGALNILEGMRIMWAIGPQDPYSGEVFRLSGAVVESPMSVIKEGGDGVIAVFGGSTTPSGAFVPFAARGLHWTNEKILTDAIWLEDKSNIIQGQVEKRGVEEESVCVLSSGDDDIFENDEKDEDIFAFEESLESPASLAKIKRPAANMPLQSSSKRLRSFPSPKSPSPRATLGAFPEILDKSEGKSKVPRLSAPDPKQDMDGTAGKPAGGAAKPGFSSILAAVLESDDEDDNEFFLSLAKAGKGLGQKINPPFKHSEKSEDGTVGALASTAVSQQPKECSKTVDLAKPTSDSEKPSVKMEDAPAEEAGKCNTDKQDMDDVQLGKAPDSPKPRSMDEPKQQDSGGSDDEQLSQDFKKTVIVSNLICESRLLNEGVPLGGSLGRNYKKFKRKKPTLDSQSSGEPKYVEMSTVYTRKVATEEFQREQEDKEKYNKEADALFLNDAPVRRIGLTGRKRATRGGKKK